MVKWQGVLPYTWQPFYEECRATMAPEFQEHVLFIDNTTPEKNIGCMASHNRGVEAMYANEADWLVVMSPAIRFGERGGMDIIETLEQNPTHNILEAAGVYGWHLICFSHNTFDFVGNWDENFTPYSFDDIDMSLRIQKVFNFDLGEGFPKLLWDKFPVDVTDTVMGHSLKYANIEAPANPRIDYFRSKWNQHPGDARIENTYTHPFNDDTKALSWWPTPPDTYSYNHGYWEKLGYGK